MGIFDNIASADKFFKKKEALSPTYPIDVIERNNEILTIAQGLKPLLLESMPVNFLIYGLSGTGKKSTIAYLMREVLKERPSTTVVKVGSAQKSQYRSMVTINNALTTPDDYIPFTGVPEDIAQEKLRENFKRHNAPVVVIMENVGEMEYLGSLVKELLNIKDSIKPDIALIARSDTRVPHAEVAKTLSPDSWEWLEFAPYRKEQLRNILKQRIPIAFNDGVFEEGVVEELLQVSAERHYDADYAMKLLRRTAETTSLSYSNRIRADDVRRSAMGGKYVALKHALATLTDNQKDVLRATIKAIPEGKVTSSKIHEEYIAQCEKEERKDDPIGQRSVSNILADFEELGIVSKELIHKGRYGNAHEFNLEYTVGEIEMILSIVDQ